MDQRSDFQVGSRVRYSAYARENYPKLDIAWAGAKVGAKGRATKSDRAARHGTIMGESRSDGCVRVLWDGLRPTSVFTVALKWLEIVPASVSQRKP
jgi:lipoate-protein ligase A